MRCEAQHCGQRQYLYDDLQIIRLKRELILIPPAELWPAVVTRVKALEDVERLLLNPLRVESESKDIITRNEG